MRFFKFYETNFNSLKAGIGSSFNDKILVLGFLEQKGLKIGEFKLIFFEFFYTILQQHKMLEIAFFWRGEEGGDIASNFAVGNTLNSWKFLLL